MKEWIRIAIVLALLQFSISSCKSQEKENQSINNNDLAQERVYTESNGNNGINKDDANGSVYGSRQNAITKAIKMCSPAIVGINVTEVREVRYQDPFSAYYDDPFFRQFFGERDRSYVQKYSVQELGSGFIISENGYILTNHHVAGNASKILVTMTDGKKYEAEIIGSDKATDVALIKIKGNNFPFIKLANSDEVIIGEWAIAFGNPFGLFDLNAKPTVTVGVVSNKGINFSQEGYIYRNMIQTDAAISSGNSGGPLINSLGEVIGINTVIFSTAQTNKGAGSIGIGWSIPINRVKKIIDQLKSKKAINRNYTIGMEVRDIDERIAKYLGIKQRDGVVVTQISRKSLADEAGFEPGDIIEEIDGNRIFRRDDFNVLVYDSYVGQTIVFSILRDDKKITKKLELKQVRR
jgi:serine protease Do